MLYPIASGKADLSLANGLASNGYAEHSPGQYSPKGDRVEPPVTGRA